MGWLRKLLPWLFVVLIWDASPTTTVTGYKVYAGPDRDNLTLLLDAGPVLTVTLTDADHPRCLAVTAYDGQGNESVYSNIVCETPGKIQELQFEIR